MTFPLMLALLAPLAISLLLWRYHLKGKRLQSLRTALEEEKEGRLVAEAHLSYLQPIEKEVVLLRQRGEALSTQCGGLQAQLAAEQQRHEDQKQLHQELSSSFQQAFKALSSEALEHNNQSFLKLATTSLERFQDRAHLDLKGRQTAIEGLLDPMQKTLTKFETKLEMLDKARTSSEASLTEQLANLSKLQYNLQQETAKIASSLSNTRIRGRWGEIQLRRVVELAGMLEHCDFHEQPTDASGSSRPDLIVHLPAGRSVIIDAKAPLDAYLEACEATEESQRKEHLKKYASHVRRHIRQLASKEYTRSFDAPCEFVVLFFPGEFFFSAALQQDANLIELGIENEVILATPTTLISLLRTIHVGWQQANLSQQTVAIKEIGTELHHRLVHGLTHWTKVGKQMNQLVKAYNDSVGSLERRLLPKARELSLLLAPHQSLPSPEAIPSHIRIPQLPEGDTTHTPL